MTEAMVKVGIIAVFTMLILDVLFFVSLMAGAPTEVLLVQLGELIAVTILATASLLVSINRLKR